MSKKWLTLKSKIAYDHPFFRVREDSVQLPNGLTIPDYTVWESGDVAQVVPITADGKYLLTEQYKHGLGEVILELPGGFVDKNESPLHAAKRELSEETGYTSDNFSKLGTFCHHPSKENGKIHLYLATNIKQQSHKLRADTTEDITLKLFTKNQVLQLIANNKVIQTGTLLGLLLSATGNIYQK